MFVRLRSALFPAALLLAAAGEAHAQSSLRLVAIQATTADSLSRGVGILRPRYTGECFVVTPRHVAPPTSKAAKVQADGPRGNLDSLVSVAEKYSDDLAVWRMPRRVDRSNCTAWPSVDDVNRTLERAARAGKRAHVLPWTEQGPGRAVEVTVQQLTLTRFTVHQTGEKLAKGMSGSPVQVDGMAVGILLAVDTTDDGIVFGDVLRLDYLERHFGPFFDPSPSPNDAAIVASLLLPGLGQGRTRRVQSGLFWFGLAAGSSAYLFFDARNEQVARTRTLPDDRVETYFETRPVNPYRDYSWIPWFAAGVGSWLEARAHARRNYIPPERSGARADRDARVRLRPSVQPEADGGMRVQVGELRF
jgi:hypothetical protein